MKKARNHALVPERDRVVSSPEVTHRLWSPLNHLLNRFVGLSGGRGGVTQSRRESNQLLLISEEFKNYKVISDHHQHSSLLHVMSALLGYMFRPLSAHLQAFKIFKINIKIVTLFLIV